MGNQVSQYHTTIKPYALITVLLQELKVQKELRWEIPNFTTQKSVGVFIKSKSFVLKYKDNVTAW
jgi:hypothetical protein